MRVIALIALVCVSSFALKLEGKTRTTQRNVQELSQSKWGKTILEMVELHALAGGPLQELTSSIEDFLQEIADSVQELDDDFGVTTNEFNSRVRTLTQEIQDAEIDYQRSADTLENLLQPRRSQIKNKIAQNKEYQAQNRQNVDEETLVRGQEHEEFESLVSEYNGATAAVDDALNLLASLNNPSLIQVKKFHISLKNIENKIKANTIHAALIKALITLAAEQNFADQNTLREIIGKLNEFRNSVVDALNDATANEADAQADFVERIDSLNAEYAVFSRNIVNATIDLDAVQGKIDDTTAFQSQRDSDRKSYASQLELENSQYAEETQIYTDLKNENLKVLATGEQALSLLRSADFANISI